MADVLIILGSETDKSYIKKCEGILKEYEVSYDVIVSSAHREPEKTTEIAKNAKVKGYKVIIAAAGYSAALPGFIASLTELPVIGVPLSTSVLKGVDSILSMVQMPARVPVLTVGINNASNAAHGAIRILKLLKQR